MTLLTSNAGIACGAGAILLGLLIVATALLHARRRGTVGRTSLDIDCDHDAAGARAIRGNPRGASTWPAGGGPFAH